MIISLKICTASLAVYTNIDKNFKPSQLLAIATKSTTVTKTYNGNLKRSSN